ncbi:MAG: peptidoglycan-binding protein [Pseudomonadota bacterium]|nr:peptidoglycan-binding protein [Pseudomonadota bacterium]
MKAGAMGDRVRELQAYLKILCDYSDDLHGELDDDSGNALKALQSELKLVPTGEWDKATELELEIHLELLRGALRCLGFFDNGVATSDTDALRQALIDFQADQNLPENGCLDRLTRSQLSAEITKLQSKLYFLGEYKGFVDGTYNSLIVPAIFAFQARLGLPASGIRDTDTRVAIIQNAVILPDGIEMPDRSKREKVTAMQRKLYSCGQYRGPHHGLYDASTTAAVSAFQIHHKLPRRDGVCDDYTWWQLNQESGTVFAEAFQWELDALDEERSGIIPDKADPRPASDSDVVQRAHRNQLCGLAFSGGGIRSATFNLGIGQALAEHRLLREFHYLSTVSGGGYIGSWLSKWIHEEAGEVEKVEEKLAIANRQTGSKAEPDQIKFLRQYSNYLTPQLGALGADTWAVIATYLRNVMLNMAILVAVLSVVMLIPRLLLCLVNQYSLAVRYGELYTPGFAGWFGGIALGAFLVAVFFISLNISLFPDPRNKRRSLFCQEQKCVLISVVAPLMISGFFGSVWLWYEFEGIRDYLTNWHYWLLATVVYLAVWTVAWIIGQRVNTDNGISVKPSGGLWSQIGPHLFFSVAALIIGHLLIAFVISRLEGPVQSRDPLNHPVNLVTFGMPVALSVFGLVMVLLVGLLGRAYSDRSREWWSRMGGWTIIFTGGWVVLFTISLYGPPFITWLNREIGAWASSTLTLSWLLPSLGGVFYGKSERSDVSPDRRGNKRLLAVAPPIFVLGLLLLITVVIQSLITDPIIPNAEVVTLGNYFHTGFYASELTPIGLLLGSVAGCIVVAIVLAWRVDINKFSLYMLYRNRLVRCYLGASNANRQPHPFTGFDIGDDPHLSELLWKLRPDNGVPVHHLQKPFHLINTALNLVKGKELAWQERKAASFLFSPGFCGFETPARPGHLKPTGANDLARGCFRATREYGAGKRDTVGGNISVGGLREKIERFRDEEEGVKLGQAMAISGAAASPNMGYHSNPALAFLMTAFNVRLGRWSANPRQDAWRTSSPSFGLGWLVKELLGSTNADSRYVYLSDGGHFENLGIYELVRRRCALIVAIDASADSGASFNDLGAAMRKCFTDFGIEIDIQVKDIEIDPATKLAKSHWVLGEIKYGLVDANCKSGLLLYVKPSLIGNEPADLLNYRNIDRNFPHQSTSDQFFDETQFESYRKLGYHIGGSILGEICRELDRKIVGDGDRRAALIKLLRHKLKQAQSHERLSEEQILIHELKGKLSSARQSPAAGKLTGGNWGS